MTGIELALFSLGIGQVGVGMLLRGDRLREGSFYRLLADHGQVMFPDDYFADLYTESARGRPTVAARVMATVMLLQSLEGLSDREACDRLECDLRWQAAAGVDAGAAAFHPTALVGMRSKLRAWARPRRLFDHIAEMTRRLNDAASAAGRPPEDIWRILNVSGTITDGPSEGMFNGPVAQWVDDLAAVTVTYGFDTFIFWGEGDHQLDRYAQEVVPAVHERLGR